MGYFVEIVFRDPEQKLKQKDIEVWADRITEMTRGFTGADVQVLSIGHYDDSQEPPPA